MIILGLSAFYHDSAAAIVEDGKIIAAAQEERFSRIKNDSSFPSQAISACLRYANYTASDIDYVVFYEKPLKKFLRILQTIVRSYPKSRGFYDEAIRTWLSEKIWQKRNIASYFSEFAPEIDWKKRILFTEHHASHAASAFFPSPFADAAILTVDGVGEFSTTTQGVGRGNTIELNKEIRFPHSLGLLYATMTSYLGFKVNSGEYKVMGLAPYGEPKHFRKLMQEVIDVKEDGSFELNMDYFSFDTSPRMFSESFDTLFGGNRRSAREPLRQDHMDLASSVQKVAETVILRLASNSVRETGLRTLCLAGGVALNCVANGKLLKAGAVDQIWIQPAAGDAGGALGAALYAYYGLTGSPRVPASDDAMNGSYLGPSFDDAEIESALRDAGAVFSRLHWSELVEQAATDLAQDKAVGWFQGRMEFGPRALGNRSILANPRSPTMQRTLNLKVKHRESFRPFAPSVLRAQAGDWFDLEVESPYMLLVTNVHAKRCRSLSESEKELVGMDRLNVARSEIPAVTHVDYSARVQTVTNESNHKYYSLIDNFFRKTGVPLLVNTSFNVRGEPIVCSPADAIRCFMNTNLDSLYIGNFQLIKSRQSEPDISMSELDDDLD